MVEISDEETIVQAHQNLPKHEDTKCLGKYKKWEINYEEEEILHEDEEEE